MASSATTKATTLPVSNNIRLSAVAHDPPTASLPIKSCNKSSPVAAAIVGTARKNENSAALLRVSFCDIPPTMVAIERLTPGIIDTLCITPIQNARFAVTSFSSRPLLNIESQNSIKMPPNTSITGTTHIAICGLSRRSTIGFLMKKPITAVGTKATNSSQ